MWKYFPAALALIPAAAFGQLTMVIERPTAVSTPPGSSFEDAETGGPHTCLDELPAAAIAALPRGSVHMTFIIDKAGTTSEIEVTRSSGNSELDKGAMACASRWIYRPALLNGRLMEMPWNAGVIWSQYRGRRGIMLGNRLLAPVAAEPRHNCLRFAPDKPAPRNAVTTIAFTVTTDGRVKAVHAERSSGDAQFDAAAVECASLWTYSPAQSFEDGATVETTWRENISWIAPQN